MDVAHLAERWLVVPEVASSILVVHPKNNLLSAYVRSRGHKYLLNRIPYDVRVVSRKAMTYCSEPVLSGVARSGSP